MGSYCPPMPPTSKTSHFHPHVLLQCSRGQGPVSPRGGGQGLSWGGTLEDPGVGMVRVGRSSHLVHSCLNGRPRFVFGHVMGFRRLQDLAASSWGGVGRWPGGGALGPWPGRLPCPHWLLALLPWVLWVLHAHGPLLPRVPVPSPCATCCLSVPSSFSASHPLRAYVLPPDHGGRPIQQVHSLQFLFAQGLWS